MSEEDTDPTHPQRQRTVIPFAWESAELRLLKVQLDNHETALSIAKGKGVRQPVARDQHDRLSDLPRPANAPAWHTPNWKGTHRDPRESFLCKIHS